MLQYPINVYPDKVALDSTKSTYDRNVHFTFKGDILSSVFWRVFEYNTQKISNTGGNPRSGIVYTSTLSPLAHNNEEVTLGQNILAGLQKKRYLLQMMFTQTRNDIDRTQLINVCDRFVSRGKVVADCAEDSTYIKIEDRINVIYEWNNVNGIYSCIRKNIDVGQSTIRHRMTDIVMKIEDETYHIENYNYNTGEIGLTVRTSRAYPAGTPYQLYANYLVCEQYYFEVAAEPVCRYAPQYRQLRRSKKRGCRKRADPDKQRLRPDKPVDESSVRSSHQQRSQKMTVLPAIDGEQKPDRAAHGNQHGQPGQQNERRQVFQGRLAGKNVFRLHNYHQTDFCYLRQQFQQHSSHVQDTLPRQRQRVLAHQRRMFPEKTQITGAQRQNGV